MNGEWNWRRHWWLCVVSCFAGGLLLCAPAAAQSAGSVLLELPDRMPEESAFRAALSELLERIAVHVTRSEGDPGMLAEITISLDEEGATLRVYPRDERRSASKHRVPRAESDAIFRETLAHVVLGAVEPLTVEESPPTAASPSAETPEVPGSTSTAPALVPGAPRAFQLGVATGPLRLTSASWAVALLGDGELRLGQRVPWLIGLTVGVALPREEARSSIRTRVWLTQLRAQAGALVLKRSRFELALLGTFGTDLSVVRVETERATRSVRSPVLRASPLVGLHAQLDVWLRRGLVSFMRAGCELDLTPHEFTAREGPDTHLLLAMARVRPQVTLGAGWRSRW